MRIFVNYKQNVSPDHDLARAVALRLRHDGHYVFRDESNIMPSEEWPVLLEQEIKACDTMLSLISNSALRSLWVLNEIDLALRLNKRILPVLLEDIDDSLRFQALYPRFMSIQWLTATGDADRDCEAISEALREIRLECYRDLVMSKLDQYGINDGCELFEAMFGPLYQGHWPAIVKGQPAIQDSERRLNGEFACSLVEALRNHIESWSSMQDHNARNYREHGSDDRAKRLSWQVQRLKCAGDILNTLIAGWTRNALASRQLVDESNNDVIHLFDNSDGERAFVSPDSPAIQGGPPDEPVPKGHIVKMVEIRKSNREVSELNEDR